MTLQELTEKINRLRADSYLRGPIETPLQRANRRDELFSLLMAYFTLTAQPGDTEQ